MQLILLGAPGVGKGTQANQIAQKYNIPQISTGEMLRAAVRDGTPLGKKAKGYIQKGELVPDDIIIDLIQERLQESDCEMGFILDGFPRSLRQAEALDVLLKTAGKPLQVVFNIEAPSEAIVTRLKNRRICRLCGKDYNIITNPPPASMKCIECGGDIYQRADDTEETIRNRLTVYNKETAPLISYYRSKKILKTIDGSGEPGQAFKTIVGTLKDIRE